MKSKFISRPAVACNCGVIAILLLTLTVTAQAQLTNSWTNSASGFWQGAANWSLGVAPSNNQAIVGITNANTKTVTINANDSGVPGRMTISNLVIVGFGPDTNTLQLDNALTSRPLIVLNEFALFTNAVLVVSNSALRVDGLLGGRFNVDGATVLIDGLVVATNAETRIGHFFASSYTMNSGTQQVRDVFLGDSPTGNGTLTVAGGVSTLSSNLNIGETAGGTGTVWVTGGQLVVTNAQTNIGFGGSGQLTVSNGTVVTREVFLGSASGSQGTLTVAGGNCTLANSIGAFVTVGNFSNAVGTIWVTGGQLTIANGLTSIGGFGNPKTIGQVTVSNGTWLAGGVSLGGASGSQGTLTVAGGTNFLSSVTVGDGANATGAVWITGGQIVATNGGFPSIVGNSGIGQMMTSTGLLLATSMTVGSQAGSQGTLTVAGGTNIFKSGGLLIGDFANSTGAVWVTGGRLVTTNFATFVGFNGVGQMTVSNGSFVTGNMDVGNGGGSRGTLTMFGVTNTWTALNIGDNTSATGTVWLTDVQVAATNGTSVGAAGIGQLTMSNSTLVTTLLNVAGASSPGGQGTLTIVGSTVTCSGGGAGFFALFVGGEANSTGTVWFTSGQLVTTNAETRVGETGVGRMTVSNGTWLAQQIKIGNFGSSGTLTVAGGTVSATSLTASNSAALLILNSGVINTAATTIYNGLQFADGDGINAATYHLLGGVHTFNNGLRVRNNATLSGCGTINGVVVVDPGGSVVTDCGSLTFNNGVTNNGIMHAENGSVLESYGPVVNNGIIDIMDGTTNFHSTFINNGTIVDASYFRVVSLTKQSNNINIAWTTVGGRSYVVQTNAPPPGGSYTNNFSDLSPTNSVPGTSLGTTNYLDLGGAANAPTHFYRIHLVP